MPAPNEWPTIRVILGTVLLLTALTSFAPRRMMPRPLGVAADIKAVHVLNEEDRQPALIALEHEPRGLVGAVGIDHAAELDRAAPLGAEPQPLVATTIPAACRPDGQSRKRASGRTRRETRQKGRRRASQASRSRTSYWADGLGANNTVKILGGRAGGVIAVAATEAARVGGQQRDQPPQAGEASVVVGLAIVDRAADGRVHVAPPSSSWEISWPIAAFTSAGPARYRPEPSVISTVSQSTGR